MADGPSKDTKLLEEAHDMIMSIPLYTADRKPGARIERWGYLFPNIKEFLAKHFEHRMK